MNKNLLGRLIPVEHGFLIEIFHHLDEDFLISILNKEKPYYYIGKRRFELNENFEDYEFRNLDELIEAVRTDRYDARYEPEYDKKTFENLIEGKRKPEFGNLEHIKVIKMMRHRYLQANMLAFSQEGSDLFGLIEPELRYDFEPLPSNFPLPYIDDNGRLFGMDKNNAFSLLEEEVTEAQIGSEKYNLYRYNYRAYWS